METYIDNTERWLFIESLKDERWVRMKEHPLYFVSNYGRIKSDMRKAKYACHGELNTYRICKSKILKLNTEVYLTVGLKDSGKVKQKKYNIHRLVAMAFLPNPEGKPFVNHKDGNKYNNYVHINFDGSIDYEKSNLEWCTYRENLDHAIINDLVAFGARSPKSKLTEQQVVEIKKLLSKGYTCKDIAIKYNLHISTISRIQKEKNWRRIPFTKEDEEFCLWNHVLQKDRDGALLNKFNSVNDAHRKTGFSATQIRRCCKGERDLFQGYKWEFMRVFSEI